MKVAKIGNELVCAEVGHYYETLRGTGRFKYHRPDRTMRAPWGLISLNILNEIITLPPMMADERIRLMRIDLAIRREKERKEAKPLCHYPVKASLMDHQIRGANMALLQFGVIQPEV